MARGIKISQLDEFTNSDGSEYLTAVKAGATKKIKIQNIAVDALSVSYDNTISGISAINVKDAIDEVESIKIDNTEKGSANGIAVLGADSKIISSQIPAIAIVDTFVVANQTEQLALSAQQGDIAIRSDEAKTYVHNGGTAGDMTDWDWMQTPASAVLSVNSQTGVVTGLEEVINRQNAISDDDSKYPSSGAVVDYLNTHIAAASAHHDNLSNGLNIIPNDVTTTGNIKINSDLTSVRLLFGTAGDTTLYRMVANTVATDGSFIAIGGNISVQGTSDAVFGFITHVVGDTSNRWGVRANGLMLWSDGAGGSYDTNLYRDAANVLKTDDTFQAIGFTSNNVASSYTHSTTTKYLVLGPHDIGESADVSIPLLIIEGLAKANQLDGSSVNTGYIPIHLPIGSTITSLTLYGDTDSSTNSEVSGVLRSISTTSGDWSADTILAQCSFNNSATSASDATIVGGTILSNKRYQLTIGIKDTAGAASFYSAVIAYTTSNMSQTV